mmetsp:Transcript_17290/g.46940  ORF Transcript_17290/g.46940 Transcript_17290/m.46940 type:complete len:274 (-) Transcript_17290:254-1075(-)
MPMALIKLTMARSTSRPVESKSSSLSSTKISPKAPPDTASARATRADMALGSHVSKNLRSSHLDAKKMLQAHAIAPVTCSTARARFKMPPCACIRASKKTAMTTNAANEAAAAKSWTEQRNECSSWGSSRPSWFGITPEMAKRKTCTVKKDSDRADTSFSISQISSSHRERMPRRWAMKLRTASKRSPRPASTAECATRTPAAESGPAPIQWCRRCREHPALMEAKPVMWAHSRPHDCIMLCRLPRMHSGSLKTSAMNIMTTSNTIIQPTISV